MKPGHYFIAAFVWVIVSGVFFIFLTERYPPDTSGEGPKQENYPRGK